MDNLARIRLGRDNTADNGANSGAAATGGSTTWTTATAERFYIPPAKPVEVKLVLPHKKHLVPQQQRAKEQEQLKVWGLRKR